MCETGRGEPSYIGPGAEAKAGTGTCVVVGPAKVSRAFVALMLTSLADLWCPPCVSSCPVCVSDEASTLGLLECVSTEAQAQAESAVPARGA